MSILYAEHLLARVNNLEREGAVLRSLEKPLPLTLYQLYEVTIAECFRRTESSHRALVFKLLQWILYSLTFASKLADIILFFSDELGEAVTALEVAVIEVVNIVLLRYFSIISYSNVKREILTS